MNNTGSALWEISLRADKLTAETITHIFMDFMELPVRSGPVFRLLSLTCSIDVSLKKYTTATRS